MSSKADEIQEVLQTVTHNLQDADSNVGAVGQLVTEIMELAEQVGTTNAIEAAAAIGQQADELNLMVQQAINKVMEVNGAVEAFKAG